MANIIEQFEHEGGMTLVWSREENDEKTTLSFEYGTLKITEEIPETKAKTKDGKISVSTTLTRNQVKSIIDMYAKLYEPRIVGWSNQFTFSFL